MKKFLKLGLCFLSLAPISLAVYSCSTNTRVEDDKNSSDNSDSDNNDTSNNRIENDKYYDVNDEISIKDIDYDFETTADLFWQDLVIYNKNLPNEEILKSRIDIDLRFFKHLQSMNSNYAFDFFIYIIDKWVKQFSNDGINAFKGEVNYFFPDSFERLYGGGKGCFSASWMFTLPYQKFVDFGNAKIKEMPAFNINNDLTKIVFPESTEVVVPIYKTNTYEYDYSFIQYVDFYSRLETIIIPPNITFDDLHNISQNRATLFNFDYGFFKTVIQKVEYYSSETKTYYYDKKIIENYTFWSYGGEGSTFYFRDDDIPVMSDRNKKGLTLKISNTFNTDWKLSVLLGISDHDIRTMIN
ncbi:MAG: hypothetical protein K2H51_02540, partial [Malacoplasma sp.]|nr:hypothetical protein [Malacoplasma sp.]